MPTSTLPTRHCCFVGLAVFIIALIHQLPAQGQNVDITKVTELEGVWDADLIEHNERVRLLQRGQLRFTFRGEVLTTFGYVAPKRETESRFSIDSTSSPKKLDFAVTTGKSEEQRSAVYALEGDTLTIAFPAPKAQRPTSVRRPAGPQEIIVVFRRQR